MSQFDAPAAQPENAPPSQNVPTRVDIERIAHLVYQMMLKDLAIERERGAWERAI
ncbi:MAG: hypothetical protein JO020_21900 [Chloroflexi bacterium]|nr:hypothetical protein [Chloroflexota bacterium]MBV9131639.1 hypothetical protein [Chloroflexota bacterium]MBV9896824.1 hypothetical protein [Chloroflexota bacterium]